MDLQTVIDSTPTLKKPRRNHTDEFKLQLIQQAQQPGESVAKVAMQYQVNANLLHKWIRQNKSDTPQSEQQTEVYLLFYKQLQSKKKHFHQLYQQEKYLFVLKSILNTWVNLLKLSMKWNQQLSYCCWLRNLLNDPY